MMWNIANPIALIFTNPHKPWFSGDFHIFGTIEGVLILGAINSVDAKFRDT